MVCLQALKTVEASLGRPTAEVFASISPAPLAAASLGQVGGPDPDVVHRGQTLSNSLHQAGGVQPPLITHAWQL